jgi:alginate O-acetyltransferase complex protein AlgI
MVFSDPLFLFIFLPACLFIYWAGGWRARSPFAAAAGLLFYMWGGQAYAVILVSSIVVNHYGAVIIHTYRDQRPRIARWVVISTILLNLVTLGIWKYAGFAVDQVTSLLRAVGIEANFEVSLALPIAISFFTFQSMSYVIDVWRREISPAPRLVDYAAYIFLFPQLISGPIVRYSQIESDLLKVRVQRFRNFSLGAPRFFWGLGKKILIADQVSAIANSAFGLSNSEVTSAIAWIGVIAFAIQIYFDFSAYSDMAIGLAQMFGYRFPENFDHPYSAATLTDFWRRWHISLSTWFRDYLYIPLGGNRRSARRTYMNLAVVFFLTGLWHGANWTFIAWGLFHGAILIVERITGIGKRVVNTRVFPHRILTFGLVCFGWALFNARALAQGLTFMKAMIWPTSFEIDYSVQNALTTQHVFWLLIGMVVVFTPSRVHIGRSISTGTGTLWNWIRLLVVVFVAPMASIYALSGTFSPCLHYQF